MTIGGGVFEGIRKSVSEARKSKRIASAKFREDALKQRQLEISRINGPATTGDIERLIAAINTGWIGRGFAIGFGMSVLGFIAGLIFAMIWSSISGGI